VVFSLCGLMLVPITKLFFKHQSTLEKEG